MGRSDTCDVIPDGDIGEEKEKDEEEACLNLTPPDLAKRSTSMFKCSGQEGA
jgi:hypothetical protein